jgi:hypothetical protein
VFDKGGGQVAGIYRRAHEILVMVGEADVWSS